MSFRTKLMSFFVTTIVVAVAMVAWGVSVYTRAAFEEFDRQRSDALVAQFRREYAQRGDEIAHRMQSIADAEASLRMAMDLNRPQADASQYYNDARGIAQSQQLDFLDIVSDDGTLISSSEWPERFGHKDDWMSAEPDWNSKGAFLRRVETPDAVDLGLLAVRSVRVGEKRLFLIGGQRLDQNFLGTLVLPEGMRALLYRNLNQNFTPADLTDPRGPVSQPELFSPMVADVQKNRQELQKTISSGAAPNTISETFNAIPLAGRDSDLLGVLLVGSSRQKLIQMLNFIRVLALMVGGCVILLGLVLGWWISARVTRPIEELAAGAREVAAGNWGARVEVHSSDEVGQLAEAFNEMTRQLAEQRERLVQTERVAAWRELARRLAHELKNPLFPLQLTVENLQRAREQTSEQFDEVFFESTATLRAELENLKTIVSRFSDFAKMPAPEFEPVDVNELVRATVKLFEPQLAPVGRPPITSELYLDENLPRPQADPILLRRALENLILNSLDAMPAGGTLTVRTAQRNGAVRLEVTDTGEGLAPEECARLFTPYYTTKRHGTGLGLAIVQSVVSDHSGRIEVESAPGAGATFRIELPMEQKLFPEGSRPSEDRRVDPPIFTAARSGESRMTSAKAHLLLIDDDPNTLASLSRAFRLAGYEATVCDNAARALELIREQRFDLIFSDVVMPGKDGISLLEDLKTAGVTTPVVMISGQANVETAVRATRLGAVDFLEKPLSTDKLLVTIENVLRLRHLENENRDLRRLLGKHEMIWSGPVMEQLMAQVIRVAASEARVAIQGETGTGKELIARTIHQKSARHDGPFVTLNCAAVPAELIESELFGHEKGSFTGAATRHIGKFEQASGGTLFLDEIGDMPLAMQSKLLRVLEEGEIERVGGDKPIMVDARVVVATHRNLEDMVRQGLFRADLFHRVNVFPIVLPPLRERVEEIPALAVHFAAQVASQNGWRPKHFSPESMQILQRYAWPGNVRELRNVIERVLLLSVSETITDEEMNLALPASRNREAAAATGSGPLTQRMESFEREVLLAELRRHHHHMTNTARALGLERSHLYKKCQQLGIDLQSERK